MTKKRILSIVLCLCMICSLLPVTALAEGGDVTYLYCDTNGQSWQTGTKAASEYTVVATDTTTWGTANTTTWYVVQSNIEITKRITVSGNVHLILQNGCTLTASAGISVTQGNSFTVYAQSTDADEMGTLTATGGYYQSGIGGDDGGNGGIITINGGSITADGKSNSAYGGAGIGGGYGLSNNGGSGGTITINGGTVNANGGHYSAGIGGGGGGVNSGKFSGGDGGTIIINGGTVYANRNIGGGVGNTQGGGGGTVAINGGCVYADGIGGGKYHASGSNGSSGSFSLSNDGIVITTAKIQDTSNSSNWNGLVISSDENQSGIYGDGGSFTLSEDIEIPAGTHLKIDNGETLTIADGVTLTNNGTMTNDGTISGNGAIDSGGGGTIGGTVPNDIKLEYKVTTSLTKLTFEGAATADNKNAYAATLTAETGYELPESISMTMGGNTFTDFTYDKSNGSVSIAAEKITGNIVITAEGKLKAPTISDPKGYSATYDGSDHEVGITATHELQSESNTISYAVYKKDGENYPSSPIHTTAKFNVKDVADSGTYKIVASITVDSVTATAEQEITVSITKTTVSNPTTPTPAAVTYDPSKTLANITLTDGWVWADGSTVPTVGNSGYTAYYAITDDANYDWTSIEDYDPTNHRLARTITVTVSKATPSTPAAPTGLTATYGDQLSSVTLPNNAYGVWSWENGGQGVGNAGTTSTFKATYTPNDATNYETVTGIDVTVTVKPQPVEVPQANSTTYTYNGSEQTYNLTANSLYTISNNTRTEAGSQTVTVTLSDTTNYEWSDSTVAPKTYTFTIGQKDITDATITLDTSPTYNGEVMTQNITSVKVDELTLTQDTDYAVSGNTATNVGGSDYALTITGTGNFTGTATATWNVQKATYSGAVTKDFYITNGDSRTGDITLATLLGTVPDGAKIVSVTPTTAGNIMTSVGIKSDDNTAISYVSKNNGAGTTATDTYTIGVQTTNYKNFNIELTFKAVDKTDLSSSIVINGISGLNKTYDGDAASYSGSATVTDHTDLNDALEYKYEGRDGTTYDSETAPTNAGKYNLFISIPSSDEDYIGTAKVAFEISKKTVTITGLTATKTYDGDNTATLTGAALDGVISTDSTNVTLNSTGVTAAYNNANVGEGKAITISGTYSLTGTAAGNYSLTQPTGVTGSISVKEISLTGAAVSDKNYDGDADAEVTAVTFSGAVGTLAKDTDYEVTSATFPDANADESNVNVTISVVLKGTAATNYTLTGGTNYEVSNAAKINKIAYGAAISETKNVLIDKAQTGVEVDMTAAISGIDGASVVSAVEATNGDPDNVINNVTTSGNTVKFDVASVAATGKTATINVTIESTNYTDITATITVTTVNKTDAGVSIDGVPTTAKTYGDADFTLTGSVADAGSGTGVWTWESSNADVLTVDNNGKVTIVGAGSATITASYESDSTMGSKTSTSITVNRKSIAVPVEDETVYTYNGEEQTYKIAEDTAYTITGGTQTNANETGYTVTVTLNDKNNTQWLDNSVADKTYTFIIKKATVTVTAKNVSIYTGGTVPVLDSPTTDNYTVSGIVDGATIDDSGIKMEYQDKDGNAVTPDPNTTGEYVIAISGVTLDGGGSNYNDVAHTNGTLKISRKSTGGGGYTPPTPQNQPNTSESGGWTEIQAELKETVAQIVSGDIQPGETVTVQMNGATEVPKEVLAEIAGQDINVEFDMGGGVTWTVNGQDIPVGIGDLDLGINTNSNSIPVNVIDNITGEASTVQLELSHDGPFGTVLHLSVNLGNENKGYWANLYYYNEILKELVFKHACRIDADGKASWPFDHASSYAIVIDDKNHDPDWVNPFTDVSESDWFYSAVEYVNKHGLMQGTGDGTTFSPNVTTSRGMIVTILWRLEGEPNVGISETLLDVPESQYYYQAVKWAISKGILEGYGEGYFGPDDPITREQMATILWRYAKYKGIDVSVGEDTNILSYNDALEISEYAIAPMQWACGEGIIGGYNGNLTPQGNAKRSEAAAMLMRFLTGEEE